MTGPRRAFEALMIALCAVAASAAPAAEPPFQSRPLTRPGLFTRHIEGPAVGPAGDLFVPNLGRDGTVARIAVGSSKPTTFLRLPSGSIANGARFDRGGRMFLADYKGHSIFVVAPGSRSPQIYFHSAEFHQPNDLAIALDGSLYASDPDFRGRNGRIWRIASGEGGRVEGFVMAVDRIMGVANGVDLSPDEKTLYVSESNAGEIWAYAIEGGRLARPQRVIAFGQGAELDGLRTDADGRIFVARPGAGSIAVVEPGGSVLREIKTLGANPTNLTFGGPDGKTVFVTNASTRAVERFLTDRPGREFCWRMSSGCGAR